MVHRAIEDMLRSLGLTRSYRGYQCLVEGVLLAREEPRRLELVTKALYPHIARQCCLTVSGVDCAMRTAIRVCTSRCGPQVAQLCQGTEEPTVSQFLSALTAAVGTEK